MYEGKKINVMIGCPCGYGQFDFQVTFDWMGFMYWLGKNLGNEYNFYINFKSRLEQSRAREEMALDAQQMNMDYILMLDDDQILDIKNNNDYSFIESMLNTMEINEKIGVLGALYFKRQNNIHVPCAMMKINEVEYRFLKMEELTYDIQRVDSVGGGCMLIRVRMFNFLEQPIFIPEAIYSTDIQICRKAVKAGWDVYLDSELQIGHLMQEREVISIYSIQNKVNIFDDLPDIKCEAPGEILKLI